MTPYYYAFDARFMCTYREKNPGVDAILAQRQFLRQHNKKT